MSSTKKVNEDPMKIMKDLVVKLVCDKCRLDKVHIFHRINNTELKQRLEYFFQLRYHADVPPEYFCKCGCRLSFHSYEVFDSCLNRLTVAGKFVIDGRKYCDVV